MLLCNAIFFNEFCNIGIAYDVVLTSDFQDIINGKNFFLLLFSFFLKLFLLTFRITLIGAVNLASAFYRKFFSADFTIPDFLMFHPLF